MKRINLIVLLVCCVILIITGIDIAFAFPANPTLSYDGKVKEFALINTQQTDLFRDFKNAVPGDVITQIINLRGENIQNVTDVYLRAETIDDVEIPEDITLKVYAKDELISESSLNNNGVLTEGVHLYQFKKSGSVELNVVFEVPVTIGNEISDMKKEIRWIFTAQEGGAIITTVPKTGDEEFPVISMFLNISSIIVMIWIFVAQRRERKEKL